MQSELWWRHKARAKCPPMFLYFRQPFEYFATNPAIQCTELYEYCQTLGGKGFSIPSFQVAPIHTRSVVLICSHVWLNLMNVAFRCTSSCMPAGCWTVGLHLRPFITARWWDRRSSDRGSLSSCSLESLSRFVHLHTYLLNVHCTALVCIG